MSGSLSDLIPRKTYAPRGATQSAPANVLAAAGKRIRTILVPLDGTAFAEHAIPVAVGIARQSGAVLRLVHVMVPLDELHPYEALVNAEAKLKTLKRRKHRYLSDLASQLSAESSVFISSQVVSGSEVSEALDEAKGLSTDLIVMATHGRGAIGRFWWGSVAHSLMQRTDVPVILVRGSDEPASLEPRTIDHVILPFDGTKHSERVVDPLLEMGLFAGARHTLLHVVPLEPNRVVTEGSLGFEWLPSKVRWSKGEQYLRSLARKLRKDGRLVESKIISSDVPAGPAVVRFAEQNESGLVAVAYRKRGAIERLLLSGISEDLFRDSTCPLMFVPVDSQ